MAGLLHACGQDAEAKVVIDRAISLKETLYGNEPNEEVAASLHNLGSILLNMNDLKGAEAAIRRSLDMKKVLFGTNVLFSSARQYSTAGR